MTFQELYKKWIETKSLYVKRSTLAAYRLQLRNHILPAIGEVEIETIKSDLLQRFINDMLGKGLSIKSTQDVMITVKMIMRYGAEMELIPYKKFNLKYPTRNIDDIKRIETYSVEEQKRIVKYITDNPSTKNLGILIVLCAGMRIGEVCALKWENIDLDVKVIKVRSTVSRIYDGSGDRKTSIEFSKPKTIDSNRDIPIQTDLYRILKKYQAVSCNDYFVISGSRNLIEPRTFRNYYKKFITEQVGLNHCIKFHGLRHTFATRLVESGAEITAVSKIMGHSDVSITMNLYVHPTTSSKAGYINKSMKGFF